MTVEEFRLSDARRAALEVIAEVSDHPADSLRPEMDLVGELGIDSPKALQLLIQLEERLSIEISDEDAEGLNTVGDILAFVGREQG